MSVDYVDCEALETVMIEDFQDLGSSALCNGFSLGSETSPLCHGDPALWGSDYSDPADWPELPYGDAIAVHERVCVVHEKGLSCWNGDTGHGFFLSRAQYTDW